MDKELSIRGAVDSLLTGLIHDSALCREYASKIVADKPHILSEFVRICYAAADTEGNRVDLALIMSLFNTNVDALSPSSCKHAGYHTTQML